MEKGTKQIIKVLKKTNQFTILHNNNIKPKQR